MFPCGSRRIGLAVAASISCGGERAWRASRILFPPGPSHPCHMVLLLQCCPLYQLFLGIAPTLGCGAHSVLRPPLVVAFPLFCLVLIPPHPSLLFVPPRILHPWKCDSDPPPLLLVFFVVSICGKRVTNPLLLFWSQARLLWRIWRLMTHL